MKKKILVTGGAGYIGSHAAKALFRANFLPITYDNLSVGHKESVRWGPLIVGDLKDKELLRKTIREEKPLAVLHFAANALVGESTKNPMKYYDNNVSGTLSLLQSMKEEGVSNIIFSSSCATFGNPLRLPIDEEHPQNPINPYGRSKLMIEQILSDYDKAYGIRSICLRYFNAAGADLEGEIGENHEEETHLIPLILLSILKNRELQVFGSDFATKDKSAIRDYIHVSDLADAHLQALYFLLETKQSAAFNLGTGKGISVLEMVDWAEKICKKKVQLRMSPRREGDPAILIAATQKANSLLHWTPQCSDPKTLIESAWGWHKTLSGS
jgi:UDP-glucose-4-epimerase GalE